LPPFPTRYMDIKFLHAADLHLGVRSYERWLEGRPARLDEFLAALDWAVDLALEEEVHFVVIAGDVYDKYSTTPLVQREWARRVARMRRAGLPLVVVLGNHDRPRRLPAVSGQAVFGALSLPGVHIVSEPELVELETAAGPVTVAAVPWLFDGPAGRVLAAIKELKRLVREEWGPRLEEHGPAIFAGHVWLEGGKPSSEAGLLFDEAIMPAATIAHPAFSYYALGHLHSHQSLPMPEGGPAVYAGSPARIDFSDEDVPKGAVLVELARGAARWRLVETSAREFVTVAIEAESDTALEAEVRRAAAGRRYDGAVVRLRVTGPPTLASHVKSNVLLPAFEGAFTAKVIFEPRATEKRRRAGIKPESGLRDALRQYMAEKPPSFDVALAELLERAAELGEGGGADQ
jgi:exonuclease SbcD